MAGRAQEESIYQYKMKKPIVLITAGDPRGIGPEVTEKALKDPRIKTLAHFIVIETRDKTGFGAVQKAAETAEKAVLWPKMPVSACRSAFPTALTGAVDAGKPTSECVVEGFDDGRYVDG